MTFFKTIAAAFAMFSKIPMPRVDWTPKTMRYMMCAFPLVGTVAGALFWGWGALCASLGIGSALRAAGLVLIPVAVSGGVHLDGFCDTADALASHAETERKLEILKDSHTGAFAVISVCSWFLLYFAFFCELDFQPRLFGAVAIGFTLSRSLSGFAVASFPCAKNSGLLHTFADGAAKRSARVVLGLMALLCAAGMVLLAGWSGALCAAAAAVVFCWYYLMARRQFGGITGDIAGWFVQVCELSMAGAAVLGGLIAGVIG